MANPVPNGARASTLLGAVIYMMTAYQRNRCPRLALAISAHLDGISSHPEIDAVLREVAHGMRDEWKLVAGGMAPHAGAARTPVTLN